jgi:hypothetical protein
MCKCVRINPINIQPSQVTLVQRCWISGFDQQGNVKEIFSRYTSGGVDISSKIPAKQGTISIYKNQHENSPH